MIKINRLLIEFSAVFLIFLSVFIFTGLSKADAEDFFYLESIPAGQGVDFTLASNNVNLTVPASTTTTDIWAKMTNIVPQDFIHSYFNFPENLGPLSDLYSVRFPDGTSFAKQPTITVKFPKGNASAQLYFFNWGTLSFEKLDAVKNMASSTFTFQYPKGKDFLMFAVFGEPEYKGNASWYVYPKYRGQMIAASTMYPNGTKLKVTNLDNNKEINVVVRDYGPDPVIHPDRVVDLSKEAFAAIAPTSQGIAKVKVSKIE